MASTPLFRASLLAALALAAVSFAPARAQQAISTRQLQAELAKHPTGADATALADRIRATVGAENLKNGTVSPRVDGVLGILALETSAGRPHVSIAGNIRSWDLDRVGDTDVYAAVVPLPNYAVTTYFYEAGGKRVGPGVTAQIEYYPTHPDAVEHAGVPKGKVTQMPKWTSTVYPNTTRDWWIYVPAQYKPDSNAALMVFQDGGGYVGWVPTVFDNLIAEGDMPVTIGVFINPGQNRSFEYDTLSDQYVKYLRQEILPEVKKVANFSDDPERRAICGISSGGICAFTAAWEAPDLFHKVLSHVGSFTDIQAGENLKQGGHNYPPLIRKTFPRKPLRVYLQDGSHDLDNEHGNWPLANQQMAAALNYAGYDYRFDFGQGFHSMNHGRAVMPDALRWLWRDVR